MRMSGISCLISQTMYQTDYKPYPAEPRRKNIYKPREPSPERSKYRAVQMDLEIMQPFRREVNVPFNLLHERKRIVQFNPHDPIPNVKLEDKIFESKLNSRRVRPSVYMVPQIDLDEVPEDIMYVNKGKSGLVSSIYSSDWEKACRFAVKHSPLKSKGKQVEQVYTKKDLVDKAINRTRPQPAVVIPPMEIGLEKYVPAWEKLNPVEFVDTTKMFWEKNPQAGLCSICDPQPASKGLTDEEREELEQCLKENALRTPFTLHPPGYTGYVPNLALGIPFRKKKFTKYDQFVTTSMEAQNVLERKYT